MEAIKKEKPDLINMAAAKLGGIVANSTSHVEFLNDNIRIQTNIFEAAHTAQVPELSFLGSSCIYPKFARQPVEESSLLAGQLEESNKVYAIAKILESYKFSRIESSMDIAG